MPKRSTGKIRILLFPTSTFYVDSRGCSLPKLCARLNKVQKIFDFIIFTRESACEPIKKHDSHDSYDNSGLRLKHRLELQYKNTLKEQHDTGVENATLDTYFVGLDVFEQIKECYWFIAGKELKNDELAVSIGSEVVVPDVVDNKFFCDAAMDSYSSLGDAFGETAENYDEKSSYDNNNDQRRFGNIAAICLLRCNLLFPEQKSDSGKYSRAIVARYIILNLCHFMTAELFAKALIREHPGRCVADTSWSGLEGERSGYSNARVCKECTELADEYGVANKFKQYTSKEVLGVIQKLCREAEEISKKSQKSYEKLIEYSLIVGGVGLTTALAAGYDTNKDTIGEYLNGHLYMVIAAGMFFAVGMIIEIMALLTDRRLP